MNFELNRFLTLRLYVGQLELFVLELDTKHKRQIIPGPEPLVSISI